MPITINMKWVEYMNDISEFKVNAASGYCGTEQYVDGQMDGRHQRICFQ